MAHKHTISCLEQVGPNTIACNVTGKTGDPAKFRVVRKRFDGAAEAFRLQQLMQAWMTSHHGRQNSVGALLSFELSTRFGKARVTVPGPIEGFKDLAKPQIYVQFRDAKKASAALGSWGVSGVDSHNGKWGKFAYLPEGSTADDVFGKWQEETSRFI